MTFPETITKNAQCNRSLFCQQNYACNNQTHHSKYFKTYILVYEIIQTSMTHDYIINLINLPLQGPYHNIILKKKNKQT